MFLLHAAFKKIILKFKKFIMIDTFRTFIIVAILFVAYVALNLFASEYNLPKIDITKQLTIEEGSE